MDEFVFWIVSAGLVALCVLTYFGVRAALQRIESDRQVNSEEGLWWVRLHWSHPKLRLGVARKAFRLRPADLRSRHRQGSDGDKGEIQNRESQELGCLGELVGGFLFEIPAVALAALFLVAVLLLIGLAIELIIFAVGAALFTFARTAFGHPWSIEVDEPDGEVHLFEVRGWRSAREAAALTRESIESGEFDIAAIERKVAARRSKEPKWD